MKNKEKLEEQLKLLNEIISYLIEKRFKLIRKIAKIEKEEPKR